MHKANSVMGWMGRAGGMVFALVVSISGYGCSDDGTEVRLAYIVSQDQAIGSVGLLGSTLAAVGTFANFPDEISAASYPQSCMTPAATPETGATISTQQSCTYDTDTGNTACTITTDTSACTYLDGVATHRNLVFENGERVSFTLLLDKFIQGNNDQDLTEIEFDGKITVTTSDATVAFSEAQTLSVRTPGENEPTVLDILSDYTVAIDTENGTLTINGDGNYAVGGVGANEVVVTGLEIPLDPSVCAGPTSGLLRADLVALGNVVEGFAIEYTGCNIAQLLRFKNDQQTEAVDIPVTTIAEAFEGTLDAIRAIAGAPQALVPAASEPFNSDVSVDAEDPADMWCRFLMSEDDLPMIAEFAVAPDGDLPVGECLVFAANVTSFASPATKGRSFTALLLELAGPLTDPNSLVLLGARSSNIPVTLTTSGLTANLLWDVDPDITTRAEFETEITMALSGLSYGPFATATALGGMAPVFNCLDDPPQPDGAKGLATPQDVEEQCNDSYLKPMFDLDFTRLGMWLLGDGDAQGLYIRVRE